VKHFVSYVGFFHTRGDSNVGFFNTTHLHPLRKVKNPYFSSLSGAYQKGLSLSRAGVRGRGPALSPGATCLVISAGLAYLTPMG
jgi:hypothetical protein